MLLTGRAVKESIQKAAMYTQKHGKTFENMDFEKVENVKKIRDKVTELRRKYRENKPKKGLPNVSVFWKSTKRKPSRFSTNEEWLEDNKSQKDNWEQIIKNLSLLEKQDAMLTSTKRVDSEKAYQKTKDQRRVLARKRHTVKTFFQ